MAGKAKPSKGSRRKGSIAKQLKEEAVKHYSKMSEDDKISNLRILNNKLVEEIKIKREKESQYEGEISEGQAQIKQLQKMLEEEIARRAEIETKEDDWKAAAISEKNKLDDAILHLQEQIQEKCEESAAAYSAWLTEKHELLTQLDEKETAFKKLQDEAEKLKDQLKDVEKEFEIEVLEKEIQLKEFEKRITEEFAKKESEFQAFQCESKKYQKSLRSLLEIQIEREDDENAGHNNLTEDSNLRLEETQGIYNREVEGNPDLKIQLSKLRKTSETEKWSFNKVMNQFIAKQQEAEKLRVENAALTKIIEELIGSLAKTKEIDAEQAMENAILWSENGIERKKIGSICAEKGSLQGLDKRNREETQSLQGQFTAKYIEMCNEVEDQRNAVLSLPKERTLPSSQQALVEDSLEEVKEQNAKNIESMQAEFPPKCAELSKEIDEHRKEIESLCRENASLSSENAFLERSLQAVDGEKIKEIEPVHAEFTVKFKVRTSKETNKEGKMEELFQREECFGHSKKVSVGDYDKEVFRKGLQAISEMMEKWDDLHVSATTDNSA